MADDQRMQRIEAYFRALVDTVTPIMSFNEVQRMLGYKTRAATYAWLKANGITRKERGFRRVEVIAAAMEEKK